jgi:hypothetical protein
MPPNGSDVSAVRNRCALALPTLTTVGGSALYVVQAHHHRRWSPGPNDALFALTPPSEAMP